MGMFRDCESAEVDIVKEMAEGLGSAGLRVDDLLEKTFAARDNILQLLELYRSGLRDRDEVNASIKEYNKLIGKAEDALRWLLIQREACGFRTHKNVGHFYPIPERLKPVQ